MRCILAKTNDPKFNLATEEYFLKNYKEPIFMVWINEPCVVIGKNQNTYAEINYDYVKEHQITVIRRHSGGGAVFHDFGNINFTFITEHKQSEIKNNFLEYTQPIIDFLHTKGIPAVFSGRNDLVVDGKKISGNAQLYHKNILLHHGTLLFDTDMVMLEKALNYNNAKYSTKAVESIRSRVTKLKNYLDESVTTNDFANELLTFIQSKQPDYYLSDLSNEEIQNIQSSVDNKWGTWEWTFGNSPTFSQTKEQRFDAGTIELKLNSKNGIIEDLKIYGDFFGKEDLSNLEKAFISIPHKEQAILEQLKNISLNDYIYNLTDEEFTSLFF